MDPAAFNRPTAERILRATRIVEGANLGGGNDGLGAAGNQCITAKILSQDGTDKSKFAWQQQIRTPSGWATPSNGLSGTTSKYPAYMPDSSSTTDISGTYVVLCRAPVQDGSGKPGLAWIVIGLAGGSLKQVKLQNPTGNFGDSVTYPSVSYDVYEMDDSTLIASNVSMIGAPGGGVRIFKSTIIAGTNGLLGVGSDGTSKALVWADEKYEQTSCSQIADDLGLYGM